MVVNELDFLTRVERDIVFAFQPIVSMHSGRCHAVEALMRNWDALGFHSIGALLDYAHQHDMLAETDLTLRKIALRQFRCLPHHAGLRLFFNLDNRLLASASYRPQHTLTLLKEFQLPPSALVLEVSERNQVEKGADARFILQTYQDSTLQIAIDDFGTGYAGLALLYDTSPDYLKIDRYFIANIDKDPKKKIFVSHVVSLAKTLGIKIIAEGVETEREFYVCREIGCDLVQGYLVQYPEQNLAALKITYDLVADLVSQDRRAVKLDWQMLQRDLDPAPVLRMGMPMVDVLEAFRNHTTRSYFPLLNDNDEPLGIVHEKELKSYIFSPYGRALLVRKTIDECLKEFRRRCAVTEITTPIEAVLEQYTASQNCEGIIVTQDGRYIGVLSADALLRVMQERSLQQARDQSPLTRLPGNTAIEQFIGKGLQPNTGSMTLVYLDLDNFKAFNDNYGFRRGDRVLQFCADMMKRHFGQDCALLGHIGGDDFFLGFHDVEYAELHRQLAFFRRVFCSDVIGFYDDKDKSIGGLEGTNREGKKCWFPLLSISIAVVNVAPDSMLRADHALSVLIADLKHEAKTGEGICVATLL